MHLDNRFLISTPHISPLAYTSAVPRPSFQYYCRDSVPTETRPSNNFPPRPRVHPQRRALPPGTPQTMFEDRIRLLEVRAILALKLQDEDRS